MSLNIWFANDFSALQVAYFPVGGGRLGHNLTLIIHQKMAANSRQYESLGGWHQYTASTFYSWLERSAPLQRSEELNPITLKAENAISSQISPKQGAPTQAALQCDQEVQRRIGLI